MRFTLNYVFVVVCMNTVHCLIKNKKLFSKCRLMVRNITVMLLTNLLLQSIHLNGLGQKLCQLPKLSGCDMHKLVPFIDSLINDKVHCSPALRVFLSLCCSSDIVVPTSTGQPHRTSEVVDSTPCS